MSKINFKLATENELLEVISVFKEAILEMKKNNILQWDDIYPDNSTLENDIKNKHMYVGIINDRIASVYVINQVSDEQYKNGVWNYTNSVYCVVHRLCVNPIFQNQGVGTFTMQHIEDKVKKSGFETIRLDVFTHNPYAIKMYKSLGYNKVGSVNWRKGKFYLLEKKL